MPRISIAEVSGRHLSRCRVSEYIRDLVRRDQDQKSKLLALNEAIQEGLDSGASDRTVSDVWAEAEARHRARNG